MRLVVIIGVLLAVLAGYAASAPSCTEVVGELTSCMAYLRGDGDPTKDCCAGVKDIAGQVQSKEDRAALCECLKQALSDAGQYDSGKVALLPGKCGVPVSVPPITPSTDCSKI